MEAQQTQQQPAQRNFVIPGCAVVIHCEDGNKSIEDLLGIVFQMAGSNPGATVDFWIKVNGGE